MWWFRRGKTREGRGETTKPNDASSDPLLDGGASDPPDFDRPPFEGEMLGPYKLLRVCGAGGFGTVYEARHGLLAQKVALKMYLAAGKNHDIAEVLFRRSANCLSQLRHRSIVQFYNYGVDQLQGRSVLYTAMELVDGPSVATIDFPGHEGLRRCFKYFLQITDAISHAHGCRWTGTDGAQHRGVPHGDIKPANVLLCRRTDVAKVTDFLVPDLQQLLVWRRSEEPGRTRLYGTPSYMAPEQGGAQTITEGMDVYGLGITLHRMLTGLEPGLDSASLDRARRPVKAVNPYAPAWVDDLIAEATDADPAKRLGSVALLQRAVIERGSRDGTLDEASSGREIVMGDKIVSHIHGGVSDVRGQINIGKFDRVSARLVEGDNADLAAALAALKDAILNNPDCGRDQKKDLLDCVTQVGEEATKPRPNKILLASLWSGLRDTLKAIPDLTKAVEAVGPVVSKLIT